MSNATSNGTEKPARIQSPSYPSMPLKEAVTAAGKIESRYRTSAVDRLDAAKLLGYSGLSGPANMALASLAMYGLVERAGKGEIRITERGVSVLHPHDESERKSALREAALSPQLYRSIRERFPDVAVPPEEGVVTYLNRQGFNPAAVRPAARAFLQTMAYMEELGVSDSHRPSAGQPPDSLPSAKREEPAPMITPTPTQNIAPPPSAAMLMAAADLPLNEPNLNIRGGQVRIEALLDYDGLEQLEAKIKALKMLIPKPATRSMGTQGASGDDIDSQA